MGEKLALTFPKEIKAGLSFESRFIVPLFPAPDWTLKAYLRGQSNIDIEADQDGVNHVFLVGANTTGAWQAGNYSYSIRAENEDGDVAELDSGFLKIIPDLASLTESFDAREEARVTLDLINQAIQKKLSKDQMRYTIETHNGKREIWRIPLEELIRLKNQYEVKVARLDAAKKGKGLFNTSLKIRFR